MYSVSDVSADFYSQMIACQGSRERRRSLVVIIGLLNIQQLLDFQHHCRDSLHLLARKHVKPATGAGFSDPGEMQPCGYIPGDAPRIPIYVQFCQRLRRFVVSEASGRAVVRAPGSPRCHRRLGLLCIAKKKNPRKLGSLGVAFVGIKSVKEKT